MKLSKKKTTLILLSLVALFVGAFLYQLLGPDPPIIVSRDTTYLTEPLAEDGLPDYAKYLLDKQRKGVTPENNAAIPLLQAMWPANLDQEYWKIVCDEIGMPVPKSIGLIKPKVDEAVVAGIKELLATKRGEATDDEPEDLDDLAEQLIEQCQDHPWTAEQLPPLAEWVERNAENFDLLHEAARRERYYCPSPTLLVDPGISLAWLILPDIDAMGSASRSLSTRAMLRLGEGKHLEAWRDVLAMQQLSNNIPSKCLADSTSAIHHRLSADRAVRRMLAEPAMPNEVAKEIHRFYRSRPVRTATINAMEFERLMSITTILNLAEVRVSNEEELANYILSKHGLSAQTRALSIDWNLILEELNRRHDRLEQVFKQQSRQQRRNTLELLQQELTVLYYQSTSQSMSQRLHCSVSRQARSKLISDILAYRLLTGMAYAMVKGDRIDASTLLMKVAAALAVYRCEHGDYPESLDALVPALLPAAPADLYNAKPLSYTKTDDGYLLVDCGPNGVDDGGSNEQDDTYKGYDVSDHEHDAVIAELLSEEPPEIDDDEVRPSDKLKLRIPAGADDRAIRMPPPPADWSALEEVGTGSLSQ